MRMVSPPTGLPVLMWNRVTGTVATSRSMTLIPPALSPDMIARLSMRADRDESRDVTTVESTLRVVAKASARRTATSGVTSTLARPTTPFTPEQAAGALGLPHDGGVDDRAAFHGLEGVDLDVGPDVRLLGDEAFVAEHGAVLAADALAQVAGPADDGAPQPGRIHRCRRCRG